jgi:SAM-dependent methyltransferase
LKESCLGNASFRSKLEIEGIAVDIKVGSPHVRRRIGMLDLIANRPTHVPTRETLNFLISSVSTGATILEVGCGEGHVACELLKRGYHVTGLDSDPNVIARAQARGVPAFVTSWPEFNANAPFDAIAFTRSLHHISPLREAIVRARELIKPTGLLLIEDFALDKVDAATVDWFAKILRSKQGKALIKPIPEQLVTALFSASDTMQTWHDYRARDVNLFASMIKAIGERFVIRETQSVPYFYRYLIPALPETSEATSFVSKVFRRESMLGERGEIMLLGRRIVASP